MATSKRKNVHDQFASGNTFVVAGIVAVSLFLCVQTAFFTPPSFVRSALPATLMWGLTAVAAGLALMASRRREGFSFYSDGLPYLLFPASLLVAGNQSRAIVILLGLSILANVAFFFANKHYDTIDEDEDLFHIYFRWPF
jgi:hypothetical protein